MKYIFLPLLLTLACSTQRIPSSSQSYPQLSFKEAELSREFLRQTYPHLSDDVFEVKFQNSLERPLLFFRSYVNSFYDETHLRGGLKTPVFCYGDSHPENYGFISFEKTPHYVVNDIDDTGICPLGLDILRYFSALRLTIDDEESLSKLAVIFEQTVAGKKLEKFDFKRPDLASVNEKQLSKYTKDDKFLAKKNITLLSTLEKTRIDQQLQGQMGELKILDISSYQKNDGGSAGLKRYWLIVATPDGHRELIEFKQTTAPGVSWSGLSQEFERIKTPYYVWGRMPDYYGYIALDGELFMTRTRADDYLDLAKLSSQEAFKLLSYQVQLMALFHRENLQKLGGIHSEWIVEGSRIIAQRYLDAFNRYKR